MVKVKEADTAPTSKYAAKKAARTAKEDKVVETTAETTAVEETKVEEKVEDIATQQAPKTESKPQPVKPKGKTVVGKEKREIAIDVPQYVLEIAYIVKDNAAIRRFTSLNILNHLTQIGRIRKDAKGQFVKFLWNKFRVSADGLTNEYSYREKFFLNALVGAFGQFASSAQNTISIFMNEEGIDNIDTDCDK